MVRARRLCLAAFLLTALPLAAAAQDIRGIEVCTAEKQMERRTGCLQANIELLHQMLLKQARETTGKLAAAQAEIAALRSMVTTLEGELTQLKAKAEPPAKK
ncbi:MAG: hypothetical protein ACK4UO_08140 [Pseudolabrys sp.]